MGYDHHTRTAILDARCREEHRKVNELLILPEIPVIALRSLIDIE